MQTYTVYEPRPAPDDLDERAASLVFVKEGFSFLAFFIPLIWLLLNKLWVHAVLYFGVMVALSALAKAAGVSEDVLSIAFLALNLIVGFEARDMLRHDIETRGYVLRDIVSGKSLEECEHQFLRDWFSGAMLDKTRLGSGSDFGGPGAGKRSYSEPVIGIFPAHGG